MLHHDSPVHRRRKPNWGAGRHEINRSRQLSAALAEAKLPSDDGEPLHPDPHRRTSLESNGSSYAGSLALMDAGVKNRCRRVAMVWCRTAETGEYAVLSDILATRTMTWTSKTGTEKGIALDVDIKIQGLKRDSDRRSLHQKFAKAAAQVNE
jgi:polyribonucleotide nucleotidyltransferase